MKKEEEERTLGERRKKKKNSHRENKSENVSAAQIVGSSVLGGTIAVHVVLVAESSMLPPQEGVQARRTTVHNASTAT